MNDWYNVFKNKELSRIYTEIHAVFLTCFVCTCIYPEK